MLLSTSGLLQKNTICPMKKYQPERNYPNQGWYHLKEFWIVGCPESWSKEEGQGAQSLDDTQQKDYVC